MQVTHKSNGQTQRIRRQFRQDIEHVFDMYAEDSAFNMSKTCKKLLLSRASLYRKILKHYGCTFTELLVEHRLERAKKYLDLGLSISEIAYKIGYSDPSYFVKIFHRRVGMTPGEYRDRSNSDAN